MSEHSHDPRDRLYEEAGRLMASGKGAAAVGATLSGIFEALYRLAEPEELAGLRAWLEASHHDVARPWIALIRLAQATTAADAAAALRDLDAAPTPVRDRSALTLRTEAARQLERVTGDARAAWERLAGDPVPEPGHAEAAVDAMVVRLRFAAAAGAWQAHDEMAAAVTDAWLAAAGSRAFLVSVTLAENELRRGAYAAALSRVRRMDRESAAGLRLAGLQARLQVLVACRGDLLSPPLEDEIAAGGEELAAILKRPRPADDPLSAEEWQTRRQECELLLWDALPELAAGAEPGPALSDALRLERDDPAAALEVVETILADGGSGHHPEERLRLRLLWVRLAMEQQGSAVAEICEDWASDVLAESSERGMPILEMLAWDHRALIRAHGFDGRWSEAVEDAGKAANLAVELLSRNQGSDLERPLRTMLLPVFDRAIELLIEGGVRTEGASRERFGRALLDYTEQAAQLALSEARSRMRTGDPYDPQSRSMAAPTRCEALQASLLGDEAVLQYFLLRNHLLVFFYGRRFFGWHVNVSPEPGVETMRSFLRQRLDPWSAGRPPRSAGLARLLAELGRFLLPRSLLGGAAPRRIRRLAIVPHDVLYRTPFGQLPCHGRLLGARFSLTLHPTGKLASARAAPLPRPRRAPRIGFFLGRGLAHACAEHAALDEVLRAVADVVFVDTGHHGRAAFDREAPRCDVVYVACHGSAPSGASTDAHLELGTPGERLALVEVSGLDLGACGIAVFQACWSGWMEHLREIPVQGFPQAFRDAGVRGVVAPMFPVADALCPVFTAVFCRALRYLPAGAALRQTLGVLRNDRAALAYAYPQAASEWPDAGTFDEYEYRLTGDPTVRLAASWRRRVLAFVLLHGWLWRLRLRASVANVHRRKEMSS